LSEGSHDLIKGFSGGFVVMEEVASEEDHVDLVMLEVIMNERDNESYIFSSGKIQDFIESPPAIVLADRVPFFVANMIVGRNKNADGIRLCGR
jgi:hypothetical protein